MTKLLYNSFILVGLSFSPLSHAQIVLQALDAPNFTATKTASLTGTFTKDNCPAGQTGTQVTYTTPTYKVTRTSTISQDNANNLAQNAANAKAQEHLAEKGPLYANKYGQCYDSPPEYTPDDPDPDPDIPLPPPPPYEKCGEEVCYNDPEYPSVPYCIQDCEYIYIY